MRPPLGLTEAGVIAKRMKAFDEMCVAPVEEPTPEGIRDIRMREKASKAVFARYLGVTTGLVSQREQGERRPRGAYLKFLTLVAKWGLQAVGWRVPRPPPDAGASRAINFAESGSIVEARGRKVLPIRAKSRAWRTRGRGLQAVEMSK